MKAKIEIRESNTVGTIILILDNLSINALLDVYNRLVSAGAEFNIIEYFN